MAKRFCLDCNRITSGNRCQECQAAYDARRTRIKRDKRPYSYAIQKHRKEFVQEWIATHGPWCAGSPFDEPHWTEPQFMTAGHLQPVATGGSEDQELVGQCRECNSRQGSRLPRSEQGDRP